MPTGYTAAIADGIDFRTFAMNCARAFGACVSLRDEGGGGEKIPDRFEPSGYHAQRLKESAKQIAEVQAMSSDECEAAAKADYEREFAAHQQRIAKNRALKAKYESMLLDVDAWTPPTPEHEGLKTFMREQITESIKFDCSMEYLSAPVRMSGSEWRQAQISSLSRDVGYHGEENQKEIDRAKSRTEWVLALRTSLGVR
jgi:hypothetical protein